MLSLRSCAAPSILHRRSVPISLIETSRLRLGSFQQDSPLRLQQQTRQTQSSFRVTAVVTSPAQTTPVSLSSAKSVKIGSCLVYPPASKPSAVLHFLGGAFVSAAPDVFYSHFIELLVEAGYLVIVTPYNVTFDHTACVKEVRDKFATCMELIDGDGLPSASLSAGEASQLPAFGIGHSNGALLQVLSGTIDPLTDAPLPYKGNVIIAYNNRPASEAVPYFNLLGPAVVQLTPIVQNAISSGPGIILAAAEQLIENIERSSSDLPEIIPPELADPVGRFADQLGPVFGQVQNGVSEFTPEPAENLKRVRAHYSVPSTLLVRFSIDSIDETPQLELALRDRFKSLGDAKMESVLLNGTHATPLAPDLTWQVGPAFTPADAVAVALKAASLSELRSLARTVISWLSFQL